MICEGPLLIFFSIMINTAREQKSYPIYDQNAWKIIPFGAAHTYIDHIRENGAFLNCCLSQSNLKTPVFSFPCGGKAFLKVSFSLTEWFPWPSFPHTHWILASVTAASLCSGERRLWHSRANWIQNDRWLQRRSVDGKPFDAFSQWIAPA